MEQGIVVLQQKRSALTQSVEDIVADCRARDGVLTSKKMYPRGAM
jgi:hypothetical protein